ncbi:26S proteasome regulatory complex [Capsaspora owczarzaki ATCC 30864]|uniref:26S proteasome regulatory complex n=1 Tax=Capsaspora owczarzaki (strain ATCC 30864) TaxID=595528 RepID=A0A0D2VX30_CAPO3|nr:26S proteasome regulatory complex [Capsaspora owczarzaki ATCC 30864]KJE96147.1 26S proteasome regulatory complex [Capsaspora owczarzaki ATCC 30864]|eukprot:XP_004345261.2 26S proteasome regulatory complex [Capsaspora owczarzaki ATCC 30864]
MGRGSPSGAKVIRHTDRQLVGRLQELVNTVHNAGNGGVVTVDLAMDTLCRKYREYTRRNKGAMRLAVADLLRHMVPTSRSAAASPAAAAAAASGGAGANASTAGASGSASKLGRSGIDAIEEAHVRRQRAAARDGEEDGDDDSDDSDTSENSDEYSGEESGGGGGGEDGVAAEMATSNANDEDDKIAMDWDESVTDTATASNNRRAQPGARDNANDGDGGGEVPHSSDSEQDEEDLATEEFNAAAASATDMVVVKDSNSMNAALLKTYVKTTSSASTSAAPSPAITRVSSVSSSLVDLASGPRVAPMKRPADDANTASPSGAQQANKRIRMGSQPQQSSPAAGGGGGRLPAQRVAAMTAAGNRARGSANSASPAGGAGRGMAPSSDRGSSMVDTPSVTYADLGGLESCLQDVRELIEYPLTHPEIYVHLGVEPPRGILLHGPPGCGKTLLANAIAGELELPFLKVSAPEIVSGMSGESEAKIRDLFAEAAAQAPCIVFIDEIDAITPKRETAQREMERRIVAQLLTCMDDVCMEKTGNRPVIVIGASNRPDSLDPALRRAGRFDREIAIGIPDDAARLRILQVLCAKLKVSGDLDFTELARRTPGYVGADLAALAKEAAVIAVNRIFSVLHGDSSDAPVAEKSMVVEVPSENSVSAPDSASSATPATPMTTNSAASANAPHLISLAASVGDHETHGKLELARARSRISDRLREQRTPLTPEQLAHLSISFPDFVEALTKVQPSSKREGFATIPDVAWSDVGSLKDVREELEMTILKPIRQPHLFAAYGLKSPAGVLLYGPPGCGKTLLAKAIAHESGASFISIKGPELLNKYVGESERAVRQVFQRARSSAPCVVFFDELDSVCPRRGGGVDGMSGGGGGGGGGESGASERVVNQLLTEMDGLDDRRKVFVIAATNRPDMIDAAMLRPGRLDKLMYVPLPTADSRGEILRTALRSMPMHPDVDVSQLGLDARCEGFSGADLAALAREAAVAALRETMTNVENAISLTDAAIAANSATALALPPSDDSAPAATHVERVAIARRHFDEAFKRVRPSVSERDARAYAKMQGRLRNARAHLAPQVDEKPAATAAPSDDAPTAAAPMDAQ